VVGTKDGIGRSKGLKKSYRFDMYMEMTVSQRLVSFRLSFRTLTGPE
jgi:hypothetical protein